MQLYRGMDVGTAKLPPQERRGVPHHCLDLWPVTEAASVSVYRDAARAAIDRIEAAGGVPILVGGSGLYVEAVLRELDFPATDPDLRASLEAQADSFGPAALWRRGEGAGPGAGSARSGGWRCGRGRWVRRGGPPMREHDHRDPGPLDATVRAIPVRVRALTGRPFAASLPDAAPWWRPAVRVALDAPNEVLADRLAARAAAMWAGGLLDEVRGLLPQGLADGPTASKAIGYAQAIGVLTGSLTEEEGLAETVRLTWRTVRRQRAWFARDEGAVRIDAGDPGAVARVLAAT